MSLNPIIVDVDEEGNPVDEEQLNELNDRISSEVEKIQDKIQGEQNEL